MAVAAVEARELILSGQAPAGVVVEGDLDFSRESRTFSLPAGLWVAGSVVLDGSSVTALPDGLRIAFGTLSAKGCTRLRRIGRIRAPEADFTACRDLREVAGPCRVSRKLTLDGCVALQRLPDGIRCDHLSLRDCVALAALPRGLRVASIDLQGCLSLRSVPGDARIERGVVVDHRTGLPHQAQRHGVKSKTARHWIVTGRGRGGLRVTETLDLRERLDIDSLPDPLFVEGPLDLQGCRRLRRLPSRLEVASELNLKGCVGLGDVPANVVAERIVLPSGLPASGSRRPRTGGRLDALRVPFVFIKVMFMLARASYRARGTTPPPADAVPPEEAKRAIARGAARLEVNGDLDLSNVPLLDRLPQRLHVHGSLTIRGNERLRRLPADLWVKGSLSLYNCTALEALPDPLAVASLTVETCPALSVLPEEFVCGALTVRSCAGLERLPATTHLVHSLTVTACPKIRELPSTLVGSEFRFADLPEVEMLPARVTAARLEFAKLPRLRELPRSIDADSLGLRELPLVERLPDGLDVQHLDVERCSKLVALPARLRVSETLRVSSCPELREVPRDAHCGGSVRFQDLPQLAALPVPWNGLQSFTAHRCATLGHLPEHLVLVKDLDVSQCGALESLPPGLEVLGTLNVENCVRLRRLPDGMPAPERAEIGGAGLERLPDQWASIPLTWHRIPVTPAMIFQPESIPVAEILQERNVEIRRVIVERYGLERFMSVAEAEVVDSDADAGGPRELLRVPVQGDEPIVCLRVRCPSTGRVFHLRVPPDSTSCHRAAAWLAGFHRPDDYRPIVET